MPTYGATDIVVVVILAACALPWSSVAWKAFVFLIKKASKWSLAYALAATAVAFMQYSTAYLAIKTRTDAVMNDMFYNSFKSVLSTFLRIITERGGDGSGSSDEL
jgi:hypothetical protein